MADRTVNINIKYNINTADVQKAADLSQRAQAATDNFRGSAQKAGAQVSQAFQTGGRSIAFMQQQLALLKTRLDTSTDPKRTAELSSQFKVLKTQIDAATKAAYGLQQQNTKTAQSTKSLTSQFGGLVTAVKAFIAAGVARQAVDIALSMAELSGNVEGVTRAFDRAFPNQIAVLDKLRKATHGTVNDFELMQRTLQATNLGVAIEPLPRLFEFAAARAQQTGESVDYLADSIVRGIGRKSALILDNLGISALRLKEELGGVSLQAASVGEVTEAVGRIAEEELTKMGGFAETSATSVKQLRSEFEALKITLSQKFSSSGFVSFLKDAVTGAKILVTGIKQTQIEIAKQKAATDALAVVESENYKKLKDNQQGKFDLLQQEINTRVEVTGRYNDTIKALEEERKLVRDKNPYDARIDAINNTIKAYNTNKFVIQETIKALIEYRDELNKVADPGETGDPSGIISRKKAEIELLEEQINLTNNLSDLQRKFMGANVAGDLIKKLEIAKAELGDLQRAFTDFDVKPLEIKFNTTEQRLTSFGTNIKRIEDQLAELANITPTPPPQTVAKLDTFWSGLGEHWKDNWKDIVSDSAGVQAQIINNTIEANIRSMQSELTRTKDHYQQLQTLAGDNERAKSELRVKEDRETAVLQKRIFQREKEMRRAQAVVDGAAATVKAFATAPNVYAAIIQAAFIAATTIAQIRIINKEQPRFAKGVLNLQGPGTATSDSIPAHLSKGESVMTAQETRSSMGILKAIRNKEIDDKILKNLHVTNTGVVMKNDNAGMEEAMMRALKSMPSTDYIRQANTLYEVKTSRGGLHKKIRRKSMG